MTRSADHQWLVPPAQATIRLDLFIARQAGLSRVQVKRLLGQGSVTVNGRPVGPAGKGAILRAGDQVTVRELRPPEKFPVIPEPDTPLTILASGEGWLIVDKPAGVPVHPLEPGERGTVLNAVAARIPAVQGVGEAGLRSGVVHRLDVETSGTLLLATTQERWEQFRLAFAKHETKKIYRAAVQGRLTGKGMEKLYLVVARHKPAKVRATPGPAAGSRLCDLKWRAVEPVGDATLIEVELGTGFLHQIRTTMAHLGHPVLGDAVYGDALSAPRLMLHASELALLDVKAHSPDPPEFAAVIQKSEPRRQEETRRRKS